MNELDNLCQKFGGVHKGINHGLTKLYGSEQYSTGGDMSKHGYTNSYNTYFSPLKDKKINLLEIGIYRGAGLAVWSSYFSKGKIYGLDLCISEFNEGKSYFEKYDKNVFHNLKKIYSANSADSDAVEKLKLPMFDIVIDDGSHSPENQYSTFCNFFKYLNTGGIYVIEDVKNPNRFYPLMELLKKHDSNTISYGTSITNLSQYSDIQSFETRDRMNKIIFIRK
jgi:hypothetical protein